MVKFIVSYAEDNAILLPGRIPGYKRDDVQLLPSNTTKHVRINVHHYRTSLPLRGIYLIAFPRLYGLCMILLVRKWE